MLRCQSDHTTRRPKARIQVLLLRANDLGFRADVLFVVSQTVLSRCPSSRSASFTQYSEILIKRSASWASGSSPAWRATLAAHLLISGASDIGIPQTRHPPVGLGGDPEGSRETLRTCYALKRARQGNRKVPFQSAKSSR